MIINEYAVIKVVCNYHIYSFVYQSRKRGTIAPLCPSPSLVYVPEIYTSLRSQWMSLFWLLLDGYGILH